MNNTSRRENTFPLFYGTDTMEFAVMTEEECPENVLCVIITDGRVNFIQDSHGVGCHGRCDVRRCLQHSRT